MATVVRGEVPAEEFALAPVLEAVPDVRFECERIVESGKRTVMPLIWSYGVDVDTLRPALDDDSSVEEYSLLASFGDELLWRMTWVDHVRLVLHMILNDEATVLNCYGDGTTWTLRVLYPDRDSLSSTHEFCDDHGLEFDVWYVREMAEQPAGRFGLSAEQYEALTLACERGYFAVPRQVDLRELAEEVDISHQALSERLRRAHEVLVEETLLVGPPPNEEGGERNRDG